MFIKTEKQKHVLKVSMNRPELHNAFNPEMIRELTQTFKSVDADVRAVVLDGQGKSFCAGADIEWMKSMAGFSYEENIKDAKLLFEMFESVFECPAPVIARVHGSALGGGVGLVSVCDIVAAEKETRFGFTEVKLGLVPAVISPFVMKKVPEHLAREFMMTGEFFDCTKAERMGLIHFSGEAEEVEDYIASKVDFIRNNGPQAVRSVKSLLKNLPHLNWAQVKDETVRLIGERRVSAEGQEGLNSFLNKRAPQWKND